MLNECLKGGAEYATLGLARQRSERFLISFDEDSVRQASQGQFSIGDRDKNNPHIKRVRVVSTVEYFLAD